MEGVAFGTYLPDWAEAANDLQGPTASLAFRLDEARAASNVTWQELNIEDRYTDDEAVSSCCISLGGCFNSSQGTMRQEGELGPPIEIPCECGRASAKADLVTNQIVVEDSQEQETKSKLSFT